MTRNKDLVPIYPNNVRRRFKRKNERKRFSSYLTNHDFIPKSSTQTHYLNAHSIIEIKKSKEKLIDK